MKNQVLIVTSDERLGKVLALEADACGAQALVTQDLQSVDWEQVCVAIADLDSKVSGVIPEQVRVLGLCRDSEVLSLRARRMAHMIFHRPFLMEDLRRELIREMEENPQKEKPTPVKSPKAALELQAESRCVLMGNRQISLTEREYTVLSLLVQKGEQGITKQELAELLDAKETNEGQVYICRLRQKLENAFGLRLIKTVRNYGYVYVGDR